MLKFPGLEPVDYLIIGHITQDLTPTGPQIGGTAYYAGRTAQAFGLRVGIVTAWGEESGAEHLEDIAVANQVPDRSTTFQNSYTPEGRIQKLLHLAPSLDFYHIPELWRQTPIIHLGPVAQEVNAGIARYFPEAFVCLTPQGWLRQWDADGRIQPDQWPEARHILRQASAVVVSSEDLQGDPAALEALAEASPILAVTQGVDGVTLYVAGSEHHLPAPQVTEVDPTGAGDVFAAAFFSQLNAGRDPLEAAELANRVAADSVTRRGHSGVPTQESIYDLLTEV